MFNRKGIYKKNKKRQIPCGPAAQFEFETRGITSLSSSVPSRGDCAEKGSRWLYLLLSDVWECGWPALLMMECLWTGEMSTSITGYMSLFQTTLPSLAPPEKKEKTHQGRRIGRAATRQSLSVYCIRFHYNGRQSETQQFPFQLLCVRRRF